MLFDRFNLALAERERSAREVGVLFCDVDDFKSVNDRFGHKAGDRLLCDIADRLRSAARDVDTIARIAGDEFVLICPGLSGCAELDAIAERVARGVAGMNAMPDGSAAPHLTVGAVLAGGGEVAAEVLHRADVAMYTAKAAA